MKSLVVCKMPKAGLGNQLFPLMHAMLFSKLNNLDLVVIGYRQVKLGPYLRGERSKRNYKGYFRFEKSLLGAWSDARRVAMLCKRMPVVHEPAVRELSSAETEQRVFWFEKLPTYHDYFVHLREHRKLTLACLSECLQPWIFDRLNTLQNPVIGVHVRMGDFRKLQAGEEFRGGHVRTPLNYFTDLITRVREASGKQMPVTLFSDGFPSELRVLTDMPEVKVATGNPDVVDLLLLSRSRVIIATTGSTFSYWAAFLSDAEVILHPDHIYAAFRPPEINANHYEGPFTGKEPVPLLQRNLRAIN